jgi:hypothetical protein
MTEPIVATKDRPGSYDAIESAKPGEPLFPIQGGDPFGPPTVLHWVQLCRKAGLAATDEKEAERLLRKATDAEQVAWEMQAYQRGHPEVEARRATYHDVATTVHAEADDVRKLREAMIHGASRLHNVVAEAATVVETLARFRTHPGARVEIREALALLKLAALRIEPRRGSERS